MRRTFAYIVKCLPWVGMMVFAWLWLDTLFAGVGWNYMEESYQDLESTHENLKEFVLQRKNHSSDLETFQFLNLINREQYEGKYDPYLSTSIGMVEFDELGAIRKICGTGFALNGCPDFGTN